MKPLPPIDDEIRQAPKPKIDVALKPRPELPDETIEANSKAIGERWGSATQLRPAEPPKVEPAPTAPLVSVRFDAPDYLDRELSVKAAEQGVTKTHLILKALGSDGYRLDDVDLVKDRRRWKR